MASILGGGLPPLSLQDVLENSGRLVDKFLQDDRSYLDLSEQLQVHSHSKEFYFNVFHYLLKLIALCVQQNYL